MPRNAKYWLVALGWRGSAQDPRCSQIIEQATGRKVRSFLSQVNEAGVAAEVFVLAREDHETPDEGVSEPGLV